ncbi:hypothetical protein ABGB18_38495 [Nonomuraea sp. B12E4]|uniref:hypothetical protein n=1 Tax=Nonomuraea sp. B12E4 TaxID=3153564 RepID=UPI00325E8642
MLMVGGPGDHRDVVEQADRYGAVGERAGAGHQEVRLVEQLDVLDVTVDPAVGASGPVEDGAADGLLQRGDLLAHRGRRPQPPIRVVT